MYPYITLTLVAIVVVAFIDVLVFHVLDVDVFDFVVSETGFCSVVKIRLNPFH